MEEVALLSDIDNYNADADTVTLMTLHAAKGLEFPVVFLSGMEEGVFPSQQSMYEPNLLEEERRLCYVGITRAKKKLYLLNAYSRMQFGKTTMNPPSVFLSEIPSELTENTTPAGSGNGAGYYGSFGGFAEKRGGYFSDGGESYAGASSRGYSDSPFGGSSYGKPSYGGRSASNRTAREMPKFTSPSAVKKTPPADIKVGDTVIHKKFGKGLVVLAQPLANDLLLEVAFDTCGTKKLMAGAAHLEKAE